MDMNNTVEIDFTESETTAIERVTGWGARDDADMRRALHDMISELAMLKHIDISDINLEDESWCD